MTNLDKLPEKVRFTWWLNDDPDDFYMEKEIFKAANVSNPDYDDLRALYQLMGKPFYEITLECELDTVTGEVTVLSFTK